MHDVLVIYKQLELRFDEDGEFIPFPDDEQPVHTLSYDEKPGIQAIACTSEDKPPVAHTGKITALLRDYEYERLGTLSLLAAIDLLTGETVPLVSVLLGEGELRPFFRKKEPSPTTIEAVKMWTID